MVMDKDGLLNAATEGDVKFLREAIASNNPIDYFKSVDNSRRNMFHLAARNGRVEFIREAMEKLPKPLVHYLLCQQDYSSNHLDKNPLSVAAGNGYNKIVKAMLEFYEKNPWSALSSSTINAQSSVSGADDAESSTTIVRPWLVKDSFGYLPFHWIIAKCREECALKLLSIDEGLFSYMGDCPSACFVRSPLVLALKRGFNGVVGKFLGSSPKWDSFNKKVLAAALVFAPICSGKIFIAFLEKNLQFIEDTSFYKPYSMLEIWVKIGKLYPFEYVLEDNHAPNLKRYIIDIMSESNPLSYVACCDYDEVRGVQIAKILVEAYKKDKEKQLNIAQVAPPWFARDKQGYTPLHEAIKRRREKVALHFLSLEKIELLLEEGDQCLFLAIEHKCHEVAQKILDLIDQHGLITLLTSVTGQTALHVAPTCVTGQTALHVAPTCVIGQTALHATPTSKEDFLKQLVKGHPQLIEQPDDEGHTVLHSWMEIGQLWAFKCILNRDNFSLDVRRSFAKLLRDQTNDKKHNPLHVAAAVGADGVIEDIIQLLHDAIHQEQLLDGESVFELAYFMDDTEGPTALDIALSRGHEALALRLFLCGVSEIDTSVIRKHLFKAIENKHHSVVRFLLDHIHHEHSVDPDCLRSDGHNALHVASKCSEENVKLIIERWPELINEKNRERKTPLEIASEEGTSWLVELILQKDHSSILKAPLAWVEACQRGHTSTVKTFIEKSEYFKYLCRKNQDTPLHHIKFEDYNYNRYREIVKIPVIQELKDIQDKDGDTPLHKAIKSRNKELTEILFTKAHADWSIKNKIGKTAVDLLEKASEEDQDWKELCDIMGVGSQNRIFYISDKTDLNQTRAIISVVAALLATITFTAGFTVPGGLNNDTGEAILTKKAAFVVFLIADTYAMCCSMVVLFTILWSMVCGPKKASLLTDRSLEVLKHSLSGTLVAFMTGVYVVIYKKSLWPCVVVLIMCSVVVILAARYTLYLMLLNLIANIWGEVRKQLSLRWKELTSYVKRREDASTPSAAVTLNQTNTGARVKVQLSLCWKGFTSYAKRSEDASTPSAAVTQNQTYTGAGVEVQLSSCWKGLTSYAKRLFRKRDVSTPNATQNQSTEAGNEFTSIV